LVNSDGTIDSYKKTFFNKSEQYKLYFPAASKGGVGDKSIEQEDDIIDVIN